MLHKFCILLTGRHSWGQDFARVQRRGNFTEIWGQPPYRQVVRVNILSGRRSRLSKLSIGSSSFAVSTPHRHPGLGDVPFSSPSFSGRTTTFRSPCARVYSRSIDREYILLALEERESFRATKIGGIVCYRRKRERLPLAVPLRDAHKHRCVFLCMSSRYRVV